MIGAVFLIGFEYTSLLIFISCSGCPEAVKLLVGNKSDLSPEVDVSQIRVSNSLYQVVT